MTNWRIGLPLREYIIRTYDIDRNIATDRRTGCDVPARELLDGKFDFRFLPQATSAALNRGKP